MQGQEVWAREGAAEICSLLQEVDDFKLWAQDMRRKAKAAAAVAGGKK